MKKKMIVLNIFLIFLLFYIIFYILYPSYLSVLSSCNQEKFEKEYPNYYIAGSVTITKNTTDNSKTNVEVYLKDKEDITIKMHELTHIKQFEKGRFYGCNYPFGLFINEIEAYTVQNYYRVKELFILL